MSTTAELETKLEYYKNKLKMLELKEKLERKQNNINDKERFEKNIDKRAYFENKIWPNIRDRETGDVPIIKNYEPYVEPFISSLYATDTHLHNQIHREMRRLKEHVRAAEKLKEPTFHVIGIKSDAKATAYIKKNKLQNGDIIFIGIKHKKMPHRGDLRNFAIVHLAYAAKFYIVTRLFYDIFSDFEHRSLLKSVYSDVKLSDDDLLDSVGTLYDERPWDDLDDKLTDLYKLNFTKAIYDIRNFRLETRKQTQGFTSIVYQRMNDVPQLYKPVLWHKEETAQITYCSRITLNEPKDNIKVVEDTFMSARKNKF